MQKCYTNFKIIKFLFKNILFLFITIINTFSKQLYIRFFSNSCISILISVLKLYKCIQIQTCTNFQWSRYQKHDWIHSNVFVKLFIIAYVSEDTTIDIKFIIHFDFHLLRNHVIYCIASRYPNTPLHPQDTVTATKFRRKSWHPVIARNAVARLWNR